MPNSSSALGQWPNAPLALVVAQVRFEISPSTNPDSLGDRIGGVENIDLPYVAPLQQVFVGTGGASGIPPNLATFGKDLRNKDGTRCLRLQPGVMTFNTSAYRNFHHFLIEWRGMLDALCAAGDIRVKRLGLRYVDFIIPEIGDVPESYLIRDFGRSPSSVGEQAPMVVSVLEYPREHDGRIRIQYNRGFGPPELPLDIGEAVRPPAFLVSKYISGASAVLDIDCWRPAMEYMSAQQMSAEFLALRKDASEKFLKITDATWRLKWQATLE